ncbi:MAG: hypothetical protein ACK551_07350 [Vampirovibrionales bacterium]
MYRTTGFQSAYYPNFTPKLSPQQRVGKALSTEEQALLALLESNLSIVDTIKSILELSQLLTGIIGELDRHTSTQQVSNRSYKIPAQIEALKKSLVTAIHNRKQVLLKRPLPPKP